MADTSCGCKAFEKAFRAGPGFCTNEATQEDLLCDGCREYAQGTAGKLHVSGAEPGKPGPHSTTTFNIEVSRVLMTSSGLSRVDTSEPVVDHGYARRSE